MKIGDRVLVVKRIPGNHTGGVDYGKPDGDVGREGIIRKRDYLNNFIVYSIDSDRYLGIFKKDVEIILSNQQTNMVPQYEIY